MMRRRPMMREAALQRNDAARLAPPPAGALWAGAGVKPAGFRRPRLWAASIALLAVLGATLALNGGYGGSGVEVLAHRVSLYPQNSLIAEVQVTLSAAAQVFVEYENPEAGRFVTALSEPGTAHTIPVVRLRPETAYAYTIGIQPAQGGRAYGPSGEFTTGPLPPELAGMQTRAAGRSSRPLIVTDYKDGHHRWYFFWDETGRIVWYYRIEEFGNFPIDQRIHTIKQKPDGNLVFISHLCCIIEITPLGQVVDWTGGAGEAHYPHHDFRLLDDGRILYLGQERAAIGAPARGWEPHTRVRTDRLHLWNPADGSIAEVWDSRDFWDVSDPGQWIPQNQTKDWLHLNSLSAGAGGQLILSFNKRHQIIALSPDFRRVEWQLGGPGSDYEFPHPGDRFYGQHTAAQLPNGHILLFDNGSGRPDSEGGAYSRALELRLDAASGAAVKVWEYRHRPDLYAGWVSSAFPLGNGHTLVNFGVNGDGDVPPRLAPLVVVEVDRRGNEVFRVETFDSGAAGWPYPRRYRAAAELTSIMGEVMLRPPSAPPGPAQRPEDGWWRQPVRDPAAFNPQLDGRRLVYRKEPCAPGEIADSFLLHLYPVNPGDLPEERREHGFENRDFRFGEWGTIRDGKCRASVPLPAYPIARIRTGQYVVASGERLWEAEIPGPAAPPAE